MQKYLLIICIILLLEACGNKAVQQNETDTVTTQQDTSQLAQTAVAAPDAHDDDDEHEHNVASDSLPDYASYYFVIADTGRDYHTLHSKMMAMHRKLNFPIDTLEREYNQTKDLIALPENHEDELYAGEYFPRRFPSVHFSLEYLNTYAEKYPEKTIALVAGISETKRGADSILTIIKKEDPQAFRFRSSIYVGCAH